MTPRADRISPMTRKLLAALLVVSSSALAQRINIPPTSRHVLDNGLTVILMEYRKVPVVHLRLVARRGSAGDPEGFEGVASVATGLMREGTTTRTARQIADDIDFIGGSLSAAAGLDYCAVRCEVLKKDIGVGLELFADIILHPSFPREELERERKLRTANLDGIKEDPSAIASLVFTKQVYAGHAYGRQSYGTKASLASITQEHLEEFHRTTFLPNNSILVVVGDFEKGEMLKEIIKAFGGWIQGQTTAHPLPTPAERAGKSIILVNKPDVTQAQIRIGGSGISIKNPDYVPLIVSNTVFGGGFTSRLTQELRIKRSLTYDAGSGFSSNLYGGSYAISTFTKNETVKESIDVILEELKKYRATGPTQEELTKARNYIAGTFARSLQSPEALAGRITDMELFGFPKNHLETYIERIKAFSLDDVKRVVRQYYPSDDMLIVLVTPAEPVKSMMSSYGRVTVVSLDTAVE
jgi:zinc protease